MFVQKSKVTICRGCGGSGQQRLPNPLSFPKDCHICGGTGKVRLEPNDTWCGRCNGTGTIKTLFGAYSRCNICGGSGIVQV